VAFRDPETAYPERKRSDISQACRPNRDGFLFNEKQVTYLFDRGYLVYGKFNQYGSLDCIFFVILLKHYALINFLSEFDVPDYTIITRDHMVKIGQGKKLSQKASTC
jgi:hypothetical protein